MSSSLTLSQIAAQIRARLEPVLPDNEAVLLAWLESPQTVKNRTSLVYELLSRGADVLVNSVVYPDWLGAGEPPGEHFYLAYLTLADIKAKAPGSPFS